MICISDEKDCSVTHQNENNPEDIDLMLEDEEQSFLSEEECDEERDWSNRFISSSSNSCNRSQGMFPHEEESDDKGHNLNLSKGFISSSSDSCNRSKGLFPHEEESDDEKHDWSKGFISSSSDSCNRSEGLFPHDMSSTKIMMSRFYLFHAACFAIIHLRNWVFIGSLNNLLEVVSEHDDNKVQLYTDVFGLIQCNGVFVNVLSGLAMDIIVRKTGSLLLSYTIMFFVTVTAGVIMSVTSIVPILQIQVVSFISYAVLRGLVYNCYSGVIALLMPQEKMGTFYGVGSMVGSWFASLQYVLFILIQQPLKGNPFWVNVGLIGIILVAYGHPVNMLISWRKRNRAKNENMPLMFSNSCDPKTAYSSYNTI